MHPAFHPLFGSEAYLGKDAEDKPRDHASARLRGYFERADKQLSGRDWLVGGRSIADPYLSRRHPVGEEAGRDLSGLDNPPRSTSVMAADPGASCDEGRRPDLSPVSNVIEKAAHRAAFFVARRRRQLRPVPLHLQGTRTTPTTPPAPAPGQRLDAGEDGSCPAAPSVEAQRGERQRDRNKAPRQCTFATPEIEPASGT